MVLMCVESIKRRDGSRRAVVTAAYTILPWVAKLIAGLNRLLGRLHRVDSWPSQRLAIEADAWAAERLAPYCEVESTTNVEFELIPSEKAIDCELGPQSDW